MDLAHAFLSSPLEFSADQHIYRMRICSTKTMMPLEKHIHQLTKISFLAYLVGFTNKISVHGRPTWANIQGLPVTFINTLAPVQILQFLHRFGFRHTKPPCKRRLLLGNQNHKYQEACQTENTNLLTIHMGVILVKEK